MGTLLDSWRRLWSKETDSHEDASKEKGNRYIAYLVVLAVAGIAFLLLSGGNSELDINPTSPASAVTVPEPAKSTFEDEVEKELTVTLGQISGVGDVKVYITWEGGSKKTLARRITQDSERTVETAKDGSTRSIASDRVDEEPIVIRGKDSEDVLVVAEEKPRVRGVLVVADGARDPEIRWRIMRAVQTVLGISAHQVEVMPKRN